MATASQSAFCPKCGGELPVKRGPNCPHCHTLLSPPPNKYFGSPDYLWHQKGEHLDKVDSSRPDTKSRRMDLEAIEEIELAVTDWARDCPIEDKVAALRDAQLIMSNLVHSSLDARDLQKITIIGKAIGKLATTIDEFFRNGGQVYDRKVGRVHPWTEDDVGRNQATR
jgi:hypothetical protein